MIRFLAPAAPLVFTSVLIQPSPLRTQEIQPERSPSDGSSGFVASHWEAIAVGASLIVAGIGTGILLWKGRKPAPKDGVTRTHGQINALKEAFRWEKQLGQTERKKRMQALKGLIAVSPKLSPGDRATRIDRIALQLAMEWRKSAKEDSIFDPLREVLKRWPRVLIEQLRKRLETLAAVRPDLHDNAVGLIQWLP